MKQHKKVYMEYFGYGEQDIVFCEVCGSVAGDIHHIIFRSQGGSDDIENLIALCTGSTADKDCCHDISHGKVAGKELTRETLFEIVEKR